MKKVLWTLNINNYEPEITKLTFPFLKKYADKIGAEFRIINERKFPKHSVTYEKLQIYELGKSNDWNIFIDADTFIHPDFFDLTAIIPKDSVFFTAKDFAPIRWKMDKHFIRDGRMIGACNWFSISSKAGHKLWKPIDDMTVDQINASITPTRREINLIGLEPSHLQDDYALSRNIAKYRLKHVTYQEMAASGKIFDKGSFWFHNYELKAEDKAAEIKKWIDNL